MANFTINGKEHELKINFESVRYLNKVVEGGSMALVGQALQGDTEMLPHIILAALKHTGEEYLLSDVEQALENAVAEERLDFLGVMRLSNEVICESHFYKSTIDKMMEDNKDAKKQLDKLLK